jgi:hypothetical protein
MVVLVGEFEARILVLAASVAWLHSAGRGCTEVYWPAPISSSSSTCLCSKFPAAVSACARSVCHEVGVDAGL